MKDYPDTIMLDEQALRRAMAEDFSADTAKRLEHIDRLNHIDDYGPGDEWLTWALAFAAVVAAAVLFFGFLV